MKILIISGFLGAGKTTFIKELSKKTKRDFVIYENEYSASGIDTKLLETESLKVWESTENCVCCTGKTDFASSILAISGTLDPEYLIVEPTGIAELGNILNNISQISYERISILKPAVIVDAVNYRIQRGSNPKVWDNQVISADTVIFSKTERAEKEEIDLLKKTVTELNPGAVIISDRYSERPAEWFTGLLERDYDSDNAAQIPQKRIDIKASAEKETFSIDGISLNTPVHLTVFLDMIVHRCFGNIERSKGYLDCGTKNERLRFDVVNGEWAFTGMEEGSESSAVFIGENIDRNKIREYLLYNK